MYNCHIHLHFHLEIVDKPITVKTPANKETPIRRSPWDEADAKNFRRHMFAFSTNSVLHKNFFYYLNGGT